MGVNAPAQASGHEYSRFFIPLAMMSISQALTYPLVAMVASRGPGGALNMAGLAQSNTFMFFLGSIASGLVTAGMTYCKGRDSFRRFATANYLLMLVVGVLHAACALPGPSHLIFGKIMGLSASIEEPARLTFAACLPLHMIFFLRNPCHVALFNARRTGRAYMATLGRIALTAGLSPLFCYAGLVGPLWAVVCLTIPLVLEVIVSWILARPLVRSYAPDLSTAPTTSEILRFTMVLSVGTVFLSMSGYIGGAFVARAPNPERVLPAAYLAMGLVGPMSFGASRIQALVIAFAAGAAVNRSLLRYSLFCGAILGVLPLVAQIPGIREHYYIALQNLPLIDLPIAVGAAFAFVFTPITVAIRSYGEGRAAFLKRPETILGGQAAYLGATVTASFVALQLGTPGQFIMPISFVCGNLVAAGIMILMLGGTYHDGMPRQKATAMMTEQ